MRYKRQHLRSWKVKPCNLKGNSLFTSPLICSVMFVFVGLCVCLCLCKLDYNCFPTCTQNQTFLWYTLLWDRYLKSFSLLWPIAATHGSSCNLRTEVLRVSSYSTGWNITRHILQTGLDFISLIPNSSCKYINNSDTSI